MIIGDFLPAVFHAVFDLFALLVNLCWSTLYILQLQHAALSFSCFSISLKKKVAILFSEIIVPFPCTCIHLLVKMWAGHWFFYLKLCMHSIYSVWLKESTGLSALKISAGMIFKLLLVSLYCSLVHFSYSLDALQWQFCSCFPHGIWIQVELEQGYVF